MARPGHDELVGCWRMDVDPNQVLELRADGVATMMGDEVPWSAASGVLVMGGESLAYSLQGDRLVVQMGGMPMTYTRQGGAPTSAQERPIPAATPLGAAPDKPANAGGPPPAGVRLGQGGDPTGAWETGNGVILLRPDGTARAQGQSGHWRVEGTILRLSTGDQWLGLPFSVAGDHLIVGSGPAVTWVRAGVAGVWAGSESSLDPGLYLSFTQYLTLFPDGSVGYQKTEGGASRTQISQMRERFSSFHNTGPAHQSVGKWQSDGRSIVIQLIWTAEPVQGVVDLAAGKMRLQGMGKLPGNEGGPVLFERE